MIKLDKNTKYFDSIYHMCKACKGISKMELRGHIKFIHVIDGFMCHTNGRYLIMVATDIENGVYQIESITKKYIILSTSLTLDYLPKNMDGSVPFPNIDSIVNCEYPNREYYSEFENHLTGHIAVDSGIALNSEYVKLAYSVVSDDNNLYVSWLDDSSPVKFYNIGAVRVFLMPIRK